MTQSRACPENKIAEEEEPRQVFLKLPVLIIPKCKIFSRAHEIAMTKTFAPERFSLSVHIIK